MHHPRLRISRSGTPRLRSRTQYQVVLISVLALIIAACAPSGPGGRMPTVMQALEAEDAVLEGSNLAVRDEPGTSGNKVVVATTRLSPASEGVEDAFVPFEITADGEYVLWARIKGASTDESAMYLGFDGEVERVELFHFGEYVWVAATMQELLSGEHHISIGHAEPETVIDAVVVSSRRDLTHDNLETYLMTGALPDGFPGDPSAEEPGGEAPLPGSTSKFDLVGNASFDASQLPADAQVWYRRMWKAIDDSVYDVYEWAASDDLYRYARDLHTHVQFLLHAFRVTGDLKILDEIDKIAQIMRGELHDSWRGVLVGSSSDGKDGYLNWVWRYSSGDEYVGKDTNKLDEMKTHALIANIAYALDLNRNLKSPDGIDYGAHADYWVDYLVNHFEAKWREREDEPKGFPIMIRPGTHTYYSWMKWHYYMSLLTGESGYMKEAERMAGKLREDVREVESPSGTALVWPRGVVSEGSRSGYLHPTVYARYAFHDALDFYFEGFGWWNEETIKEMARTISEWVIDPEHATGSRDWFSGDIGGDRSRGGIESSDDWNRMDYYRYEVSAYSEFAPWDSTGRIADITDRVMDKFGGSDYSRYIALPVAKLMNSMLTVN